jgi:dTDP-4-amino-4,6-dideoxygalactose transaminase
MNITPYGRQSSNQADIDALRDILCFEYVTQGTVVPEFESALSGYCGT